MNNKHLFSYEKSLSLKLGNGYLVELKEITKEAYKFFLKLGLTIEILLRYGIYPIKGIIRNDRVLYSSTESSPIFGYFSSENHCKVYMPKRPNKKFFHIGIKPDNKVFGFKLLPKTGKACFICAGEKDTLIMSHVVGYPAICADSENTNNITKQHIDDLKSRFGQVCIMYDNDKTGKDYQQKLSNKFRILPIDLPEIENGKDLTDYVENGYSLEDLRKMIEDKVSIPEPIWDDSMNIDDTSMVHEVETNQTKKDQETVEESIDDNWLPEYHETLEKILEKAKESGHDFVEGARNDFIVSVAGACNTKGLPLEFVEEQLNNRLRLKNFDDHLKSLRGIYSKYEESFGKSPIKGKDENIKHETPTLDKNKLKKFPNVFKKLFNRFSDERERDVSIIGLLSLLGAILKNFSVIHQNKRYYTNLYSIVSAPFASGKGVLNVIRNIGNPLNRKLAEISKKRYSQYQDDLQDYKENYKDDPDLIEPEMPVLPRLFFGGDMSSAGFKDQLVRTGGSGIMFDTEADTITQNLSTEWGDYSALLRKGLSNETIEFDRKNVSHEIPRPYISGLISGTVGALLRLIPSSEDGLFSRLIYYVFDKKPVFAENAFDYKLVDANENQEKVLAETVEKVYFYFDNLKDKNKTIEFYWDESFQDKLLETFKGWLKSHLAIIGAEGSRVLFRLGNMATRIAAILTVFRLMEDGDTIDPHRLDNLFENQSKVMITCNEDDFEATLHLMDIIRQHTFHVYENLSDEQQNKPLKALKTQQLKLWYDLPKEFQRKEAVEIGSTIEIAERTVGKYLKIFVDQKLVTRDDKGRYEKLL